MVQGMENLKTDKIRLSADGVWFHDDVEITHQRTIDFLFKSVVSKNGHYFLSGEKKPVPVIVDDVAFFVKTLAEKNGGIHIKLSDETEETLDVSTLDVGSENQLYCLIKSGAVKAKFERKVYYELMKKLDERDGYYGLVIKDKFYPVQLVAEAQKDSSPVTPLRTKKATKKIKAKKPLKRSIKKKIRKKKNHGKRRKKIKRA